MYTYILILILIPELAFAEDAISLIKRTSGEMYMRSQPTEPPCFFLFSVKELTDLIKNSILEPGERNFTVSTAGTSICTNVNRCILLSRCTTLSQAKRSNVMAVLYAERLEFTRAAAPAVVGESIHCAWTVLHLDNIFVLRRVLENTNITSEEQLVDAGTVKQTAIVLYSYKGGISASQNWDKRAFGHAYFLPGEDKLLHVILPPSGAVAIQVVRFESPSVETFHYCGPMQSTDGSKAEQLDLTITPSVDWTSTWLFLSHHVVDEVSNALTSLNRATITCQFTSTSFQFRRDRIAVTTGGMPVRLMVCFQGVLVKDGSLQVEHSLKILNNADELTPIDFSPPPANSVLPMLAHQQGLGGCGGADVSGCTTMTTNRAMLVPNEVTPTSYLRRTAVLFAEQFGGHVSYNLQVVKFGVFSDFATVVSTTTGAATSAATSTPGVAPSSSLQLEELTKPVIDFTGKKSLAATTASLFSTQPSAVQSSTQLSTNHQVSMTTLVGAVDGDELPIGAIVGAIAGVLACLLLLAILFVVCRSRSRSNVSTASRSSYSHSHQGSSTRSRRSHHVGAARFNLNSSMSRHSSRASRHVGTGGTLRTDNYGSFAAISDLSIPMQTNQPVGGKLLAPLPGVPTHSPIVYASINDVL